MKSTKKEKSKIGKKMTDREKEVLQYVVKGLTNKEIAKILMITHYTVKAHIASIMRKIGAKNRLEAALTAVSKGMVNLRQG